MAKKSITLVFNLVLLVVSMCILQLHAVPSKTNDNQPMIMNAELKVISKEGEPLRFNDSTNKIDNIDSQHPLYKEYVNEHTAQQKFKKISGNELESVVNSVRVLLHPKSIVSLKAENKPVFTLDGVSTGPIGPEDGKLFNYFKDTDQVDQRFINDMITYWDKVTIKEHHFDQNQKKHVIRFSFLHTYAGIRKYVATETQTLYNLAYYKYLQVNPENKKTIQQDLEAFESKIKAQTGFQNSKDGGVKLCDEKVPNVYCSRIFEFLGNIDSTHPYFEQYETAYLHEHYRGLPEQLFNELPFHRLLYLLLDDFGLATVQDLDDENKIIAPGDEHHDTYWIISDAQYTLKEYYFQKQLNREVPMEVNEISRNGEIIYDLPSKRKDKARMFKKGDKDYTFAARSYKLKRRIKRILTAFEAKLKAGKVKIEVKITGLKPPPVFMINGNPEEIVFQDLRYDLIRQYHLQNLRKGIVSR